MAITYRQLGINSLVVNFNRGEYGAIGSALQQINERSTAIVDNSHWQGKAADSVKGYMQDVYPAILAGLGEALEGISAAIDSYASEYRAIEKNSEAVISEAELENIEHRVDRYGKTMSGISDDAKRTLKGISDIGHIPYNGIPSVENQTRDLVRRLKELREKIVEIESTYQDEMTGHVASLVTAALNLIKAQTKTDITAYSREALVTSPEYIALAEAYTVVADELEANTEKIEQARKDSDALVQQLQEEYEERVRQAEKAKFWVGVACVVASVAVTVVTGGAAAPLVGIATGAVTGAVSAGVGSYFDQSIGTVGCPGKVSWGKVFGDAAVGGAIGAATSAIGAGFDKWGGSLTSSGLKKVAQKAAIGGLKKATQGLAQDSIQGGYDALVSGGNVLEGIGKGFDLKNRRADFAGGFVSSGIKEGLGQLEENRGWFTKDSDREQPTYKNAGQVIANPSLSTGETLGKAAWHGSIETIAGSGSSFASTLVKEGDLNKAWNAATDIEKNAETFVLSTTAEFATETGLKARANRKLEQAQRKADQTACDGNKDIENKYGEWEKKGIKHTKNGGPDFSDSPDMAGQAQVELTYAENVNETHKDGTPRTQAEIEQARDDAGRGQDYKNAYNKMVADGTIDPNEYVLKDSGAVVRTDPKTGKETAYTFHHVDDYDVRTGKGTMQLVKTSTHEDTLGNSGSRSQIQHAYGDDDLADTVRQYNNVGQSANQGRKTALDNKKINDKMADASYKKYNSEEKPNESSSEEQISKSRFSFMTSADANAGRSGS